ncbi:MAG: metallophosphoesterase [Desulfuromusa sp.]|nr:metallophosphoesterase [Desulfuromusa sp.]
MVNVKTGKPSSSLEEDKKRTELSKSNSFFLAHLSDPHLTSLADIKLSQLLNKRILGYLSWLRKRRFVHRREIVDSLVKDLRITRPDHITVTGDLTHLGLPMEYAEARQWLDSVGPPEQVTVIPGNHEAYWGRNWFEKCSMWEPYLQSDTDLDLARTANFFPSLRIRGEVALIGLCSARPSLPLLATGSLGREQLAGLETLLQQTGDRGLMRVVLIHHPPLPGIVKRRKCLTDSQLFVDVLKRRGAELVLHGHAHTSTVANMPTLAGTIPVIGVPSASELNPQPENCAKYNIYQMKRTVAGWEVTMQVRGYSIEKQRFVQEQEIFIKIPAIDRVKSAREPINSIAG